jgi:hypothetical protein
MVTCSENPHLPGACPRRRTTFCRAEFHGEASRLARGPACIHRRYRACQSRGVSRTPHHLGRALRAGRCALTSSTERLRGTCAAKTIVRVAKPFLNVVSSPLSRKIARFETGPFEYEFNLAPPIPIEGRQTQDTASTTEARWGPQLGVGDNREQRQLRWGTNQEND